MVRRNSIRLLSTWILAAALLSALGAGTIANAGGRTWGRPSLATRDLSVKPLPRPMSGEPDSPGSTLPPSLLQPLGDANLPWALRIRLALRVMLYYLPKRLP
jgi:hypothetical protein